MFLKFGFTVFGEWFVNRKRIPKYKRRAPSDEDTTADEPATDEERRGATEGKRVLIYFPEFDSHYGGIVDGYDKDKDGGYHYEHRGALRGTPGSAYPQPEPNATELPKWRPRPPKVDRAARLRAFAHADTRRETHRHVAGLKTSRPSAFAHSVTRRTPLRAADRAPPRPRPPHLLV